MPQTVSQAHNVSQQLLALSIAVQHPAASAEPQALCAAAQACKGLQQAVRQRSACNTAVVFDPEAPAVLQLRSFARWLTNHVHLVSSISANRPRPDSSLVDTDLKAAAEQHVQFEMAKQLLVQALQPAARTAAAAAAAAGSAARDPEQGTPQQQQQQQQWQLCLTSFSSNFATMPALKALPTHSLTHLQFDAAGLVKTERCDVSIWLAGLSNLQELQIDSTGSSELPGSCFAAIAQLSKLTQLHVEASSWEDVHEPLQQLLAQPPPLRVLHWQTPDHWEAIDMSALTQLERFVTDQPHPESVLPRQLRSLHVTGVYLQDGLRPLTALQQLQRLSIEISVDIDATTAVLRLAKRLPSLQHVALAYREAHDAAVAAASWKQLPQLRELSYIHKGTGSYRIHRFQVDDILAGVAAATSLTKLHLEAVCTADCHDDESDDEAPCEWAAVAACSNLSRLTGLRDLLITDESILPAGNARALTALTNLTRLVLSNMREGVGDLAGALIAQNLTQLRHLDVRWCALGNAGWDLEDVQQLVQLTELRLEGNAQLSIEALSRVMRLPESVLVTLDAEQCARLDELGLLG